MISFGQYIGVGLRGLLPFLLCMALMLVEFVPFGIRHFSALMPHLLLAGVFYWLVNRPGALPNSALFILGLAYDVMSGNLIGLMPLTLILANRFIDDQRQIFTGRLFVLSWWGFIIVAVSYGLIGWLLASLFTPGTIPPTSTAMRTLVTVAVYPIVAYGLGRFQRWALD